MPYLEMLPQLIHLSTVLTANPFAAWAAVAGVVADVNAGRWQSGAVCAGAGGPLRCALALGAVVTVQEIPLPNVVQAPVGIARGHWPCQSWDGHQSQQQQR